MIVSVTVALWSVNYPELSMNVCLLNLGILTVISRGAVLIGLSREVNEEGSSL